VLLCPVVLQPAGKWCSDRATHLALVFVESAVQLKATYALLAPHMAPLLVDVVFPLLCLSEADLVLFETDPLE
jgi:hypothetical protein